jgi:tape measure domain-containing protein
MTEEIHKIVVVGDDASARRLFRTISDGATTISKDLDATTKKTAELNTSLKQLSSSSGALKQLRTIDVFANLKRSVGDAKNALTAAQSTVTATARAMRDAGGGAAELTVKFEAERVAARNAKQALNEKEVALQRLRTQLTKAGVDTNNLVKEQGRLKTELARSQNGSDLVARRQNFYSTASLGAQKLKRDIAGVGDVSVTAARGLQGLVRAGSAIFGITIGANLVRDFSNMADNWKLIDGRIRNATSSHAEYKQAAKGLLDIAKETSTEYEAVSTLFVRTNKVIKENGGVQADTLRLVELVTQAARVSGAGVAEQNASVRQLSQGLASGVLRGDEFNSVMENSPRLAQALADGLNVPIGALREMAEQGQLTSDVVTKALLGQADKIADEFAKIPLTTKAAFTNLSTSLGDYINKSSAANAATGGLATSINDLAKNLPGLIDAVSQLVALGVTGYFIKLAGSIDLVSIAFKRLLPAAITIASLAKVLELLTAINNERRRQQELEGNAAADRSQLVATEHLLNTQVQSLEQYKAMSAEAKNFYLNDLNNALRVARLKLQVNAGTNDKLATEGARQARIYSNALAEIAKADGERAKAMKQYSDNVVAAKQEELNRLQAVFTAQKAGLKAAEDALDEARKKRADVLKEFQNLQKDLTAKPQGQILQYQVENAVQSARTAQQEAAGAPADKASKLADDAIEKARAASELLKSFKEQQSQTGSAIDTAAADELAKRLSSQLTEIADAASGVQEKVAADQVAILQKSIQDTLNQAEALKNMQVGFDEAAAAQDFDALIALIRDKAQNTPIKVPVQVVSGSLPDALLDGEPTGVRDSKGNMIYRWNGGAVFGAGTSTSDSIDAKLSNNEHVLTAREVMKAGGHGAIYRLRRAIIDGWKPAFANGGAAIARAGIPALPSISTGGTSSGMDRGTFVLANGQRVEVFAESRSFDTMQRAALIHGGLKT